MSRGEHWHQSGLDQILGCARQWWAEHVAGWGAPVKLSTVSGSAYHKAVEVHEQARIDGGVLPDRDRMRDVALEELDRLLVDADPAGVGAVQVKLPKAVAAAEGASVLTGLNALRFQTRAAVDAFWVPSPDLPDGLSPRDWLMRLEPVAVEVYGRASIVDGCRDLAGTIDGVYRDGDGRMLLVDHKTAASLSYWKTEGKGRAQASHYGLLAYYGGLPDVCGVPVNGSGARYVPETVFLVVSRSVPARSSTSRSLLRTVAPAGEDVVTVGERVRAAEQVLVDGVFPANPGWEWCGSCPYQSDCFAGSRRLLMPVSSLLAA